MQHASLRKCTLYKHICAVYTYVEHNTTYIFHIQNTQKIKATNNNIDLMNMCCFKCLQFPPVIREQHDFEKRKWYNI